MEHDTMVEAPAQCPACANPLTITQLRCLACGTEVHGSYAPGLFSTLREPYASLLELFLRVRGNVKEMERDLGLSYPTVRARLEEALEAAGLNRMPPRIDAAEVGRQRTRILDQLERGEITVAEAAECLRDLRTVR